MADSHAKMTQTTRQEFIVAVLAGLIAPLLAIFLIIQLVLGIQERHKPDASSDAAGNATLERIKPVAHQVLASIFGDKETIVDTRISGFVKTIHDKLRNIFGKDKLEAIFGDKFELGKIDFDKLTQTFPDVAEALQKLKGFSLNAESFIKAEQSAKRLDKSIASVRESQKLLNDSFQAGDITIGQYVANMRELQEAELNLLIQRREATRQQITALKATAAQSPDGQFVDEEKLRFKSR